MTEGEARELTARSSFYDVSLKSIHNKYMDFGYEELQYKNEKEIYVTKLITIEFLDNRSDNFIIRKYRKGRNGRKIYEGEFFNNQNHGLVTYWRKDGRMQSKVSYVDGVMSGRACGWDKNGTLSDVAYYLNGDHDCSKWALVWSKYDNTPEPNID